MKQSNKQKLYCYADETGQDAGSDFFIVVAIISDKEQGLLRDQLLEIESQTKIGQRKWHKTEAERNVQYLQRVIKNGIGKGDVYFGHYKKPVKFFLPMLETLEKAIMDKAEEDYRAIVCVDGIDKKKAAELTNALRKRNIKLEFVRSLRDESSSLIRLADRWVGCARAASLDRKEEKEIFKKAERKTYIKKV